MECQEVCCDRELGIGEGCSERKDGGTEQIRKNLESLAKQLELYALGQSHQSLRSVTY